MYDYYAGKGLTTPTPVDNILTQWADDNGVGIYRFDGYYHEEFVDIVIEDYLLQGITNPAMTVIREPRDVKIRNNGQFPRARHQ